MRTKPYDIQSPEDIAKEYGGNKAKIAQAAQLGMLDPTAAVLAGMFIDRMRNAQMQEQAPQQTIAQQVLGPQPAGLGTMPANAQMAAPAAGGMPAQGGAPAAPMPQPPGGLPSLPVSDAMVPSYNSGGIVAFAGGSGEEGVEDEGGVDEYERARLERLMADVYGEDAGADLSPEAMRAALGEGAAGTAYPVAMGTGVQQRVLASPVAAQAARAVAERTPRGEPPTGAMDMAGMANYPAIPGLGTIFDARAVGAAPRRGADFREAVKQVQEMQAALPKGTAEAAYEEYLRNLPGKLEGRKKEDLFGALAQFGFGMAASKSPRFLQAAGEAGTATMPTITKAIESRRAAELEALKGGAALDAARRAEQLKAIETGAQLYGKELEYGTREDIARIQTEARLRAANIAAGKKTDMQSYAQDVVAAQQGDKTAQARVAAVEHFLGVKGAAEARAATAAVLASTRQSELYNTIANQARDDVAKLLDTYGSAENKEYRRRIKADRAANEKAVKEGREGTQNTAGEYRASLIQDTIEKATRPTPTPTARPGTAPAARPSAAPAAPAARPSGTPASRGEVVVDGYRFPNQAAADRYKQAKIDALKSRP